MVAFVRRARLALNGLGLRWKIAALLAGGCALVALTIGLLIHHARYDQVASTARATAMAHLVQVRHLYEVTGQVEREDVDAALDSPQLPGPLREAALSGTRTTYLDMEGPDPAVWAARPIGSHVLSVREPLDEQLGELHELDNWLIVSGAVVVGLAALGGAGLAS
ncbi:hypothetical protein P8605_43255, partial [Streptomyces sp. T-3]|nr:hypothetical protein [Streptomyces sp. T-3]